MLKLFWSPLEPGNSAHKRFKIYFNLWVLLKPQAMFWVESDSHIMFRAFCPCFLAHMITEDIGHGDCRDFHGEFPSSPQTCTYDSPLFLRSGHFWNNAAGAEASVSREVRKIKFVWVCTFIRCINVLNRNKNALPMCDLTSRESFVSTGRCVCVFQG